MDPIDFLQQEHRLIERVLTCLEVYVRRIDQGEDVDRQDLGRFVTFIREFADGLHHGKEEKILFEAMVKLGFPRDQGPIGVMLREHDGGRIYASAMAEANRGEGPWSSNERSRIVDAALGYIELLRPHIQKEDRILYPAAREHLGPEAMQELTDSFERFESEHASVRNEFTNLAEKLFQKYHPGT